MSKLGHFVATTVDQMEIRPSTMRTINHWLIDKAVDRDRPKHKPPFQMAYTAFILQWIGIFQTGAATKSFNGNKPQNFINRFNYEFNKNSHNSSLIVPVSS